MLPLLVMLLGASPLDAAEQRFRDLRYADALVELERVEHLPLEENGVVRRLELTAIARAMVQRPNAVETFRTLLWLRPTWSLPPEFGPRVRTPWLEARAWRAKLGTAEPAVLVDARGVTLPDDPLALVVTLELEWTEGTRVRSERFKPTPHLTAPWRPDEDTEVRARLLDADGSTLVRSGPIALSLAVVVPSVVVAPVAPPVGQPRALALPIIVTAGAVALLGTGVGLHAHAGANEDRLERASRDTTGAITSLTQREAAQLDAQLRAERISGTVFLIAGAAASATAAVLWVTTFNAEVRATPTSVSLHVPLDANFLPMRAAR